MASFQAWNRHNKQVSSIQIQVEKFYNAKTPFRIDHGISHTTRTRRKSPSIDLTRMSNILEFRSGAEDEGLSVFVQPSVTMEQLVDACVVRNVICPVVIECRDMSIGGAFCGTSAESSSFRHGLFDRVVRSVEFVAGDGSLRHIDNDGDLRDIASSYGTLGVVVCLELKLRRIPKECSVRLDYTRVSSAQEACDELEKAMRDEETTIFIESLVFETECLVIRGHLRYTTPDSKPVTFLSRGDPWFILHLRSKLSSCEADISSDTVPIKDYVFRWDPGGFWLGMLAFDYFFFPFNRITRWLLDPAMRTSVSLRAFQAAGLGDKYVVKDVGVPPDRAPAMVAWLQENWRHYPILLWLVDVKQRPSYFNIQGDFLINLGVYGLPPKGSNSSIAFCQALERAHLKHGGIEPGYSIKYLPRPHWEAMWKSVPYIERRREFCAEHLPSIADKMMDRGAGKAVSAMPRPIPGIYGVMSLVWAKLLQALASRLVQIKNQH